MRKSLLLALVGIFSVSGSTLRQRAQRASLPSNDKDPAARKAAIDYTRQNFIYGPSQLGNTSLFPSGPLGNATVQVDLMSLASEANVTFLAVASDIEKVNSTIAKHGGLQNLQDYELLYNGQFKQSIPEGPDPGMLTNYTSDLLFSMERLSVNPYVLRRLEPKTDSIPFTLSADLVNKITGVKTTVEKLFNSHSLFIADHSIQKKYPPSTTKHTAYCTGLFFIHPVSGDFLPLAIKTNVGSDLVYTPADDPQDWLLAKMMFEVNDLFHSQMVHVGNSHSPSEIVYEAAIRTLSQNHPVMVILRRIMHQAFAYRIKGQFQLYATGGLIDSLFAITAKGGAQLGDDLYAQGSGDFVANYFENDLQARGLLYNHEGPSFKNFPYYEDVKVIVDEQRRFFSSFVSSYYSDNTKVAQDFELQNWLVEANGPAGVRGFPRAPIHDTGTLVDILTHMAFLTGIKHHILNTGNPATSGGVLPLHNMALFQEVPKSKGVKSVLPFVSPIGQALGHLALIANFNRPTFRDTNKTVAYAFDSVEFQELLNDETTQAAKKFKDSMTFVSNKIRARVFDKNGLSQGMPFIYRVADPLSLPFYTAV